MLLIPVDEAVVLYILTILSSNSPKQSTLEEMQLQVQG